MNFCTKKSCPSSRLKLNTTYLDDNSIYIICAECQDGFYHNKRKRSSSLIARLTLVFALLVFVFFIYTKTINNSPLIDLEDSSLHKDLIRYYAPINECNEESFVSISSFDKESGVIKISVLSENGRDYFDGYLNSMDSIIKINDIIQFRIVQNDTNFTLKNLNINNSFLCESYNSQ